ncbi:MAG: hypothetical protein IPH09_14720 [bacterium]|nr:hypothetical protein [bacterium]
MRRLLLIPLLILIAVPCTALAGHEAGARIDVGVPKGDFADNLEDPGFGLAGHYAWSPAPAFAVGVGLGYLIYGSETRVIELPLVEDVDLTTTNNLAAFHLLMQLRSPRGAVRPYLEGRFGGQYLWTESKLEDQDFWDDDEVGKEVNYDDFALVYGGGGGLLIGVRSPKPGDKRPWALDLDFKALWLYGENASYLTEGGIELDTRNFPVFRPSESETDLLHVEVGVNFRF